MSPESGIYALWVIALTGVAQGLWAIYRDRKFLRENGSALAWDNERQVLLQNFDEVDKARKQEAQQRVYAEEAAARQSVMIRDLRKRLADHGLDETT